MLRFCALLALGAIGIGLLGCGGSSSSSAKDDLIARADQICTRFATKIRPDRAATRRALAAKDPARVGASLRRSARDTRLEIDQLKKLKAPPGDRPTYTAMLNAIEAETLAIEKYGLALETPGPSLTTSLTLAIEADARRAQLIAQRYGFDVCGGTK